MAADRWARPRHHGPLRTLAAVLLLAVLLMGGQPVPPSSAADTSAPEIAAWRHNGTGHLTIEWPETIRVQQKSTADRLVLRFARPLAADASTALMRLAMFVDADRTAIDGQDFSLALRPGVRAKVRIRERRIIAVEFQRDDDSPPTTVISVSAIDNGVRLTFDWPAAATVGSRQDRRRLQLQAVPAQTIDPADLTRLEQRLQPWFSAVDLQQDRSSSALAFILQPQIAAAVRAEGMTRAVVDLTRDASARPAPSAAPPPTAFIPKKKPQPPFGTDAITAATPGPPIPEKRPLLGFAGSVDPGRALPNDSVQARPEALVFDWKRPVAAAFFVRAGHLWAVFDEPDASLLPPLPPSPTAFGPAMAIPAAGGTAMRFKLLESVHIDVTKPTEKSWQIKAVSDQETGSTVTIDPHYESRTLTITPASGRQVVTFTDPTVGDRLDILPVPTPHLAQPTRRSLVDLEFLPTIQGVAWRPLNDRLVASIQRKTLNISSPTGLLLSAADNHDSRPSGPVIIQAIAKREAEETASVDGSPDPNTTRPRNPEPLPKTEEHPPPSSFNLTGSGVDRNLVGEIRRIKRQAISRAAPKDRDEARLDLARLLVAERLGTEARTVLGTVPDTAAGETILQRQALRGAAAFLNGHLSEASDLLFDPALDDDEEIGVWRAALESAKGSWQDAAERWQIAGDTLDNYPPRLKIDLGLMAIEAAIEMEDDEATQDGFTRLTSLQLSDYDKARVDALQALRADRSGNTDKARRLLTQLADSPYHSIRTFADFQLAALNLLDEENPSDLAVALNRRLPLWRGHPREKTILSELARRFRDANALRNALETWRRLIRLYPDLADGEEIRTAQHDTLTQIMTTEQSPPLTPFEIYAAYLDFIDLTPDHPDVKSIYRHLAMRLRDLDLVQEATELLRLVDEMTVDSNEQMEVGTDIAALLLQQGQPRMALSALERTLTPNTPTPPDLMERQQLIAAQAHANLDRIDDALYQLRDLQSMPARRLRAEILWKAKRWSRLAATIGSHLDSDSISRPLVDEDQELVLWLAIARTSQGQTHELERIKDRFGEEMQEGPYAVAFDIAVQSMGRHDDVESLLMATQEQLAQLRRFRQAAPVSP